MNQGSVYRNRLKLEKVKQHEIITILGDRVRAGKVLMSVIDVAQSVFGLGLFGLSVDKERQCWRMQKGVMTIEITSGFVRVFWEVGWEVVDIMLILTVPQGNQD